MEKLYYIDTDHTVREVPKTPEREASTTQIFHTARHTGITRLLQNGVDLKTIGKIAGHSDAKMTLYYSHSNTDLTDKASDILDAEI